MKNNKLIIDERDTGKTTYLFEEINRLLGEGKNIIVMDSATEHEDKSLLKMVCKNNPNSITICPKDPNQIVINRIGIEQFINNFTSYFPYNEIINNQGKTICFDLSYFLEKGHEMYDKTKDINIYNYYRNLYNNLSEQIMVSLLLMDRYNLINNSTVVMDEIEFPIVDYNVETLQNNISFLASIHPENSFGTFYSLFESLKFISYKKRKE